MRKWLLLTLLLIVSSFVPLCLKRWTQGFRVQKLYLDYPFQLQWDTAPLPQETIDQILMQPFHYLNRGLQSYVFESSDHMYVIKLFRFDRSKNPLAKLLRSFSKKEAINQDAELNSLFSSCQLAYCLAREETGLIYLHLNQTDHQLPTVRLKNPLGQWIALPLDKYRFVIQKKGDTLESSLLLALKQKEMKIYLDHLISLLIERSRKGIVNEDKNLFRNFGFIGNRAIEIDFGKYREDPSIAQDCRKEVDRFLRSLRSWLSARAPEWVSYLDDRVEKL